MPNKLKANRTRITVVLEKQLKERLEEKAKEEGTNRSSYIVGVLKEHISKLDKQSKQ